VDGHVLNDFLVDNRLVLVGLVSDGQCGGIITVFMAGVMVRGAVDRSLVVKVLFFSRHVG